MHVQWILCRKSMKMFNWDLSLESGRLIRHKGWMLESSKITSISNFAPASHQWQIDRYVLMIDLCSGDKHLIAIDHESVGGRRLEGQKEAKVEKFRWWWSRSHIRETYLHTGATRQDMAMGFENRPRMVQKTRPWYGLDCCWRGHSFEVQFAFCDLDSIF
jgi:hypothetical protein